MNLPFLDSQYRRVGAAPELAQMDAAIAEHAPAASRVYVPAGIGNHPDHQLVRRYGRALNRAGLPVTLYADLPYCVLHGWPSWVDGRDPDPHRDADASPVPLRFEGILDVWWRICDPQLRVLNTYRLGEPSSEHRALAR